MLTQVDPSAVIALNHAVAISFAESPQAGLDAIEPIGEALDHYVYLHVTRAELLRRMGRDDEARRSYERALERDPSAPERALLEQRLAELVA